MTSLDPIMDFLKKSIVDLNGIYLFGSQATGRAKADSDIDIAVLATTDISDLQRWELAAACGVLAQQDVDLIDLRTVNTIFQYHIITEGKRIYTNNADFCDMFENRIMSDYLDLQQFRQPLIDAIRKRGSIYG